MNKWKTWDNGLQTTNGKKINLTKEQIENCKKYFIPYDKEYGSRALGRKFNCSANSILKILDRKRRWFICIATAVKV